MIDATRITNLRLRLAVERRMMANEAQAYAVSRRAARIARAGRV